jgi:peptidoglycan/LPS O-acetylase OafA/YrhL
MFAIGVDGFFAISGFLITRSWLRRPNAGDYLAARGLRILPGLWINLVVTAFVIAPIAVAARGGAVRDLLSCSGPIRYVLDNPMVGLAWLNHLVCCVVSALCTMPLAAASWFLVEKPAAALKHRLRRRGPSTPRSRQPT